MNPFDVLEDLFGVPELTVEFEPSLHAGGEDTVLRIYTYMSGLFSIESEGGVSGAVFGDVPFDDDWEIRVFINSTKEVVVLTSKSFDEGIARLVSCSL